MTLGDRFRNGLVLCDFDDHHRHRRVMQQAFSRAALAGARRREAVPRTDLLSRLAHAPADHGGLVHTTRAMQEALRLSPPVPFSPRRALADVEIAGVHVPAGTGVSVSSLALHRHPDWWTRPDAFDPDRFAPGREEHEQHSHLFVPFGGGAHLCIGNHVAEVMVKAVVARLLATRRVSADPRAGVVISPIPIPEPRGPMLLTVR